MSFITEDFLLQSETAKALYHNYAKAMPIFDYHNHLPVKDIAENKQFKTITECWLAGDHYKWRAMRTNGIDEDCITGNASDYDKFKVWAETLPYTIRNPLFHWTYLELKNYFNINDKLLNPNTAEEIYNQTNTMLGAEDFSAQNLLLKMNVRLLCTTDDPLDSLEYHKQLAKNNDFQVKVLPAFRPDKAMQIANPESFNIWVNRLEKIVNKEIKDYSGFLEAIKERHDYFHAAGCRISDHAVVTLYSQDTVKESVEKIFNKVRSGVNPEQKEANIFQSAMLHEFGLMNAAKNWTMQVHIAALRNNNTRQFQKLGPDSGYDTIADNELSYSLACFLDSLDKKNKLPRTILYSLNPNHNEVIAAIMGCFQDSTIPEKVQFGSAWWFNDHKHGMETQLDTLSNFGLLSRFIGMLTDSRSFLSFPRHEYFRRILCNLIGRDVDNGELPKDLSFLGKIIEDICYNNAKNYFGIDV